MKKFLPLWVLYFSILFSISVYAGSDTGKFKITGGLSKDFEATFDETRTVIGQADKDSVIFITVYVDVTEISSDDSSAEEMEEDSSQDSREVLYTFKLTVGSSGVFIQTIDLPLGECTIEIKAERDPDTVLSFIVKRKEAQIKQELLDSGILPLNLLPGK